MYHPTVQPHATVQPRPSVKPRRAALALLPFALLGCTQAFVPVAPPSTLDVTGNWQFASTAPAAARLASLSGSLSGAGAHISGIFHADGASSCVSPTTVIDVAGTADNANHLTLTAANLAGGTLKLTGTLTPDGKSVTAAAYTVTGGTCAFAAAAPAIVQAYSPITGNYTGTFSDPYGQVLAITATLAQTPASDPNGNFQLSGTGTLGANPCFASPATVSNSTVTGGSFTLNYTDPNAANSVSASGTFSTDGKTLNVTSWSLSGTCGSDTGTGTLTRP